MTTFEKFADPRFVVSITIMAIFAWAFAANVDDDTMKGAIIGALNIAVGFWLGSSRGSIESGARTDAALAIAATAQGAPPPPDVILAPGETALAAESDATGKDA